MVTTGMVKVLIELAGLELLETINGNQLRTLKLVYKQKRMQDFLGEFEKALGLALGRG